MRGGVKIYRGSAAGARAYLEAERGRADDYYLGEGNGSAQRLTAGSDGSVESLGFLEGDAYEAWVAGYDPETGVARGRIRSDANAVRFAEFVVNGPKSWSLAAEMHPEIATAYEKAQDAAAAEIVAWFAQHATTRVGPRGGQVAVPVKRIEACVIRHYTSRAGDPHRHLHLQINARVEAAGAWRGLDTVAVRNSISAVQGIGHAVVMSNPEFRAVLAKHGYTLDPVTGELEQMAPFVGAFSQRAEQIARHIDGYERTWRLENPGQEPGPGLFRSWDARAWADARPDKPKDAVLPGPVQAQQAWTSELADLGFTAPTEPAHMPAVRVGEIDRDQIAARAVARLTATRSAWNVFDLRGHTEQLITEAGIIADTAARIELAEDLTARAAALCVPLLDEHADGLPEHVRAWTSPQAVDTEKDLQGRFAVRGAVTGKAADLKKVADTADTLGVRLDAGQAGAVAELAGTSPLIVVTGAAGAGKTTMLATTQHLVAAHEQSMIVVTPTLKAARTAARETGAETGSAAWLAYEHGYRWNPDGQWSRLQSGDTDLVTGQVYRGPSKNAQLRAGDLLVVDEAGMLDQDTARALLHLADQHNARVALVGDPHQLPAVGRGGVLDLASRWTSSTATLDVVHRFTRTSEIAPGITGTVTDTDYARLSLSMRTGDDPGAVFDEIHARGQVAIYPDEHARTAAVAEHAATAWASGKRYALSADTREAAAQLSALVRQRLVSAGHVDDTRVAVTIAGERIGAGDRVTTRRNNQACGVANRDLWRVQAVSDTGHLVLTPDTAGGSSASTTTVTVDAEYVREHVELAYAATVYGVQGDTVTTGHLVLGESTTAQAAYVGMTRGRSGNTVHVTATDLADARQQWIDAAGRDRADLGLTTAREHARQAASQYAGPEKQAEQRLELAARLGKAWDLREYWDSKVRDYAYEVKQARIDGKWHQEQDEQLTQLRTTAEHARAEADQLKTVADQARSGIEQHTRQILAAIMQAWREDQPALQEALAARYGPIPTGALARMTGQVARDNTRREEAQAVITAWQAKWGDLPMRTHNPEHYLRPHAEHAARERLPEAVAAIETAQAAEHAAREASKALRDREQAYEISRLIAAQNGRRRYIPGDLHSHQQHLEQAKDKLARIEQHLEKLASHPLATQEWITDQHHDWLAEREREMHERARLQAQRAARDYNHSYDTSSYRNPSPRRDHGYGIGD